MTSARSRIPRSKPAIRDLLAEEGYPAGSKVMRIGPSVLTDEWAGVTYESLLVDDGKGWRPALLIVGAFDSPAYWEARFHAGQRKPRVQLRGIEAVERARWLVDNYRTWPGRPSGPDSPAPEAELRAAAAQLREQGLVISKTSLAVNMGKRPETIASWLASTGLTVGDLP